MPSTPGHDASIAIEDLRLLAGNLPPRALSMVKEWASQHRRELRVDWDLARAGLPIEPIEPLA